eukprot:3814578-Prymnesium_polylepis.1
MSAAAAGELTIQPPRSLGLRPRYIGIWTDNFKFDHYYSVSSRFTSQHAGGFSPKRFQSLCRVAEPPFTSDQQRTPATPAYAR